MPLILRMYNVKLVESMRSRNTKRMNLKLDYLKMKFKIIAKVNHIRNNKDLQHYTMKHSLRHTIQYCLKGGQIKNNNKINHILSS